MNVKGVFSHKTDDWSTPSSIYNWYVGRLKYYDPCPLKANFDGLKEAWKGDIFINPLYSNIKAWVRKAIRYKSNYPNNDVVMLLPVRTDTEWFDILSTFGCNISFIRGRLKFGGSKNGAPFPSMLVHLCFLSNTYLVVWKDYYEFKK